MKTKQLMFGLVLFSLGCFISGTAAATPVYTGTFDEQNIADNGFEDYGDGSVYDYYQNSGDLIGVYSGNLDAADLSILAGIALANTSSTIDLFGWDGSGLEYIGSSVDGKVDDTADPVGYESGTWQLTPVMDVMNYYALKAGRFTALYALNPARNNGSWSTYDLWFENPTGGSMGIELSHFIGMNGDGNEVPEPATMLLFGTGLLGLAGVRMRKQKK